MLDRIFENASPSEFGFADKSGVYAVCVNHFRYNVPNAKERILYIGSSYNVRKRLASSKHHYLYLFNRLDDMCVYTKVIYCDNYQEIERKAISVYKPVMNKHYKHHAD